MSVQKDKHTDITGQTMTFLEIQTIPDISLEYILPVLEDK